MSGSQQYKLSQTQKNPQLTRKKFSVVHYSIRICLCRPWNTLLPAVPLVKGLGYNPMDMSYQYVILSVDFASVSLAKFSYFCVIIFLNSLRGFLKSFLDRLHLVPFVAFSCLCLVIFYVFH